MIPLCSISQAQTQAQAIIFITHLLSPPLKQQNQSFNLSDQNKHSLLPFNWDNWVFIQDCEKAEWEKKGGKWLGFWSQRCHSFLLLSGQQKDGTSYNKQIKLKHLGRFYSFHEQ